MGSIPVEATIELCNPLQIKYLQGIFILLRTHLAVAKGFLVKDNYLAVLLTQVLNPMCRDRFEYIMPII